jgi:peptidyl-prolyl cis-trans isomerase B (cyclophilin B)
MGYYHRPRHQSNKGITRMKHIAKTAAFLCCAAMILVATTAQAAAAEGIAAIDDFIAGQSIEKDSPDWKTHLPRPPKVDFDPHKTYYWNLQTNVGDIKIKLFPEPAPMHVSSTIYLTRLGFYDETVFHRVIPGFMAQGGDPLGQGIGGPGYKYAGEFGASVRHDKPGMLSMANAGPNTDGSQFFLTFVATPHLDGRHTIFGEVVDGMGTVRELEKFGTSPRGTPTKKLLIQHATITVEE